jgi:hypothetical protein
MNSAETDCIVRATTNDIDRLARLIRLSFADVARRFQLTPENCPGTRPIIPANGSKMTWSGGCITLS